MAAHKDYDLVVVGEINPDLILRGDDVVPEFGQAEKIVDHARLTVGSSSVITACGAARLGLKTAFIGLVGDDMFGRFMLESMTRRGLDTSACIVDLDLSTGMSVILSTPKDRAILTYPGTIPCLRIDQIDMELLCQARHLHLGSYFLLNALRPSLPGLFKAAKASGLTVSLDSNWDPQEVWDIAEVLPLIDVFLPNRSEIQQISKEEDFEQGLAKLSQLVPTIAVKLGAQGGVAKRGNETVTAGALVVEVVDTTGAGDSFNAGFLYGILNDFSLLESLALACACGSLSTRAAGGTAAQPTLAEAQSAMQQLLN